MVLTNVAVNAGNVFSTPSAPCPGNFIENGGFEYGLFRWERVNVGLAGGMYTHAGRRSAALGAGCRNRSLAILRQTASLHRTNPGNCRLQLVFHVSGRRRAPARFSVAVAWMDESLQPLGIGFSTNVQRRAVGTAPCGQWNSYTFVTNPVPPGAAFVRLTFTKAPGPNPRNALLIDDVLLTPLGSGCC